MNKFFQSVEFKKLYPFQSHYLDLKGQNYHYLDEGNGEVVLMVHGNPTWSFYYRNIIFGLKDHYRCIVPDHIGCGLSDKPQDYSYNLNQHIENLTQLIKFLDLKKINLIVHDWGGAIGLGVATKMPSLFNKIIILNTAAFYMDQIPPSISLCRNKIFGEFLVRTLNLFCLPATVMTSKKRLPRLIKDAYLNPYDSYENRVAIYHFVKDIPMEEDHPSRSTLDKIYQDLPLLKADKLILWGGDDFCFDKNFFTKWLEIYPEATARWYADAGHYVLEDKRDECLKEIYHFLNTSEK